MACSAVTGSACRHRHRRPPLPFPGLPPRPPERHAGYKDLEHFETPYVVKLHRVHMLAPAARMFTFSHPNRAPLLDNSRHKAVSFARDPAAGAAILHGFAGEVLCQANCDDALAPALVHPRVQIQTGSSCR